MVPTVRSAIEEPLVTNTISSAAGSTLRFWPASARSSALTLAMIEHHTYQKFASKNDEP